MKQSLVNRVKQRAIESELAFLKRQKLESLRAEIETIKYQRDPLLWLSERFKENPRSVDWSLWDPGAYAGHVWDGDPAPLKAAWEALAGKNWAAVNSGVGTGKTHTLARITLWFLDCFPNSLVVTSAPKESQLSLHLWAEIGRCFHKFKKLRPYAELNTLRLVVDGRRRNQLDDSETEGWQAVGFVAGIKAGEESATKAQGFHRRDMLIILEECPGMPLPTLKAFTETSVAKNNLILAVGNPDSVTDPLATFSRRARVKSFRASGYDHPNVVLKKEVIPGAVSIGSIDDRRSVYGADSPFFNSRTRGIAPAQASDSLIHAAWLYSVWTKSPEYKAAGEIAIDSKSWNAAGVDVANSESGDKASVAYGKSNVLKTIISFQCPNANHLGYALAYDPDELIEKGKTVFPIYTLADYGIPPDCCGVDSAGLGVATLNVLRDEKIKAIGLSGGQLPSQIPTDKEGKPMYSFGSLRAQMYWAAREDLQQRKIRIEIEDSELFNRLVTQLTVVTFKNTGGAIKVLPKDEVKSKLGGKSPDEADAFVYWNWMRRGTYRRNVIHLPIIGT